MALVPSVASVASVSSCRKKRQGKEIHVFFFSGFFPRVKRTLTIELFSVFTPGNFILSNCQMAAPATTIDTLGGGSSGGLGKSSDGNCHF